MVKIAFENIACRTEKALSDRDRGNLTALLNKSGLRFEEGSELYALLEEADSGRIIASAALTGSVIKMVAVDPDWQEYGLAARAVSRIMEEARSLKRHHLFVYTKPSAAEQFNRIGFKELARWRDEVVLMETGLPGIDEYISYLRNERKGVYGGNKAAGIIVNCNPFTLGHRYLIEKAAKESEHVFVIVVEEDRSIFPFKDRYNLVRDGISEISNVTVLRSGPYAVSAATFPSYFLRNSDDVSRAAIQTRLDVTLFAKLFVPELGLSYRYVGTEPYCPVTVQYNAAMKEILPVCGVEVIEVERLVLDDGLIVSASTVRDKIRSDDWDSVARMVPQSTLAYLKSEMAYVPLQRLKNSQSRH